MPPKIQFHCNFCSEILPNFKMLVDHYKDKHADKPLQRYEIIHRGTKTRALVNAPSAQEACQGMGWMIGDCFVKELN